jgi:hypothetical protein
VWVWGQLLDHTFGLAQGGSSDASIPFSPSDPLESFRNDLGVIPFTRNAAAPGTGASARSNAGAAPAMQLNGQLIGQPQNAAVAGDVRANENAELTAVHTLLAREHNRIVALLPPDLTPEQKFQIARRVVGAEQQYITYNEFLPAVGVQLPRYTGYNAAVNPELYNEFATVAYRAHSMVNGEEHITVDASRYTRRPSSPRSR